MAKRLRVNPPSGDSGYGSLLQDEPVVSRDDQPVLFACVPDDDLPFALEQAVRFKDACLAYPAAFLSWRLSKRLRVRHFQHSEIKTRFLAKSAGMALVEQVEASILLLLRLVIK